MTPPTSLGSDGSYIWRNMVQTDGGIPYSVARSQRGSLQLKVSEAIVFEVTFHFSVSMHRDCIDPLLQVAFMSGLIQGVCGTSLTVNGVWRGTHGDLWYPLREDARFGARVYHSTCNLPPPPTFSSTRTMQHVPLTGTPTYARREWLGQPCRTPDHGLPPPLRRQWGLWDPERHRTSKPGGRGAGLAFGPIFGSDPNHHHFTTPRHRVLRSTYHVQLCRCRLSPACWSGIRACLRQACGIWCRACTLRRSRLRVQYIDGIVDVTVCGNNGTTDTDSTENRGRSSFQFPIHSQASL